MERCVGSYAGHRGMEDIRSKKKSNMESKAAMPMRGEGGERKEWGQVMTSVM